MRIRDPLMTAGDIPIMWGPTTVQMDSEPAEIAMPIMKHHTYAAPYARPCSSYDQTERIT
ncbi:hypothetical protein [Epibacterium ulvae]|uniref:hypothetical protein n=1 Tax=Epibacterium ulvae TaxID=1156985 RepID=UPI0011133D74|nr:hypothetical protein [Epibacterium ulvae]